MHHTTFIQDLAVVMLVAGVVTLLCHYFKQPVVLGYLLAGFVVGPHTPPFPLVQDEASIRTLSELGVILLMFSLGLHFSLRKLGQVGGSALVATVLETSVMCFVGFQIARWFGWSRMDALFLGGMLAISSTTIIVRTLSELGLTGQKFSELIFGMLIFEDLLAIALLALLSGIAMTGSLEWVAMGRTLGQLTIFVTALLVFGLLLLPRLLDFVARFRSDEMLLITALALCFGVALLAQKLGYSVALGAFMVGAVLGETKQIDSINALVAPVRDMFCAIFFVSIGMLIDPAKLREFWPPILICSVVVLVGKTLLCSLGSLVTGQNLRTSVRVGLGMAQIGEFSFIIASLGLTLGVTSSFLYPIAVAVSVLTTMTTPFFIKNSDRVASVLEARAPASFLRFLAFYQESVTRWQQGSSNPAQEAMRRVVQKIFWQIAINVALITALFVVANWSYVWLEPWQWAPMTWLGGLPGLIWLTTFVATLPLVVAVFLKLRALGMLTSEMMMGRPGETPTPLMLALRNAMARTVLIVGFGLLVLWIFLISLTLMVSWQTVFALAAVGWTVALLFWKKFIGLYAEAQFALHATLNPLPSEAESIPAVAVMSEAILEAVTIPSDSWVVGKAIRDLGLRERTGTSAVGLERGGQSRINPGADEILRAADVLVVLGNQAQVRDAQDYLIRGDK